MLHLQIKFGCNWKKKLYRFYIFYLTWPQMTLDLITWPLTSLTYKGTPTASLTQVWFQTDLNFSKATQIRKPNVFYLTWPQIILDLGMWPWWPWPWYVTFDLINIWRNPYCIFDPSLVVIRLQLFKGDLNNENLTKLEHTYKMHT